MSADESPLESYAAALLEQIKDGIEQGCSVSLTSRRIAALAYLHRELDPWQPCRSDFCAFHEHVSRETGLHL